jgi:hypothetical protein
MWIALVAERQLLPRERESSAPPIVLGAHGILAGMISDSGLDDGLGIRTSNSPLSNSDSSHKGQAQPGLGD